ncbi:MAG: hypothetical protein IKG08_08195 [Eubacterium sp.]|nr:hypothetical protein [Eubacterium sp.]
MSQEKVDQYKKSKAGRKTASVKEARKQKLEIGIFLVIIIAALVWFIASVGIRKANSVVTNTTIQTEALDNYINSLN